MAALTTQTITDAGNSPTFAAATVTVGDTWAPDDRTFLVVKNGGVGSTVVTIPSYFTDQAGAIHQDKTVTVGAGLEKWIRVPAVPFGDPANGGIAKATCSVITDVTIAAIRIP